LCGDGSGNAAGCVVDGDTVIMGFGSERRRIRITGFDAPEIDGACAAEREVAQKARQHLHLWLNEGAFEWSGGDNPPRDQYGRALREVRRSLPDGERDNLADTMIDSGLASASGWGADPVDWCV